MVAAMCVTGGCEEGDGRSPWVPCPKIAVKIKDVHSEPRKVKNKSRLFTKPQIFKAFMRITLNRKLIQQILGRREKY